MGGGGLGPLESPAFSAEDVSRYRAAGWWSDSTVSDAARRNAQQTPDRAAYVDYADSALTWREFDSAADTLASQLAGVGVARGARVAVWHGDSTDIHVLFVAVERCGAAVIGIGARSGIREVVQMLRSARPTLLVADQQHSGPAAATTSQYPVELLILDRRGGRPRLDTAVEPAKLRVESQLGADDVFLINSTSGTTGLPKCVVHTQNRWHYFHQKALANGMLRSDDVFLPAIPTPFGFGIWTSHTTPIYLGATAVILERFSTGAAYEAIAHHRITVLCCVSTQLTMMMADPARLDHDLSSLRVVFTGGEALPYRPAAAFEELTGAQILQFYGSNETGLLSGTTVNDPQQRRLRTGGRILPEMSVRLFDGDHDVTDTGRGQPACRGPATSLGYLGGTDHDKLFTGDGGMRIGDICEVDPDGYLTVTGRTSDFILRGGKNISAAHVEDAAMTHPAIAVASAVAMPDPVFGEKVCLYAELGDSHTVDLPGLIEHMLALGMSKELLPERLIVLGQLPRSAGGKIAKGQLREDIRDRIRDGL